MKCNCSLDAYYSNAEVLGKLLCLFALFFHHGEALWTHVRGTSIQLANWLRFSRHQEIYALDLA